MHIRRSRQSAIVIMLGCLATAVAAPSILTALGVTDKWLIGLTTGIVTFLGAATGAWRERAAKVLAYREEHAIKIQHGCLVLANGKWPKVHQIRDPIAFGVHPTITLKEHPKPADKVPDYIPRDVDGELRERLATRGFVLLVGDSAAGKSRTAYEAMQATLRDHTLISPCERSSLDAAIEHMSTLSKAVLWLNDLEGYLGTGGLTKEKVVRLVGGEDHRRVILATIRSAEESRLTIEMTDSDEADRFSGRRTQQVLEQAYRIRIDRRFGAAEQERARTRSWDPRISRALEHVDTYGIAEYLSAGPQINNAVENSWAPGGRPRAAALIAAAIDCRRLGFVGPAPKSLLEELHEHYLVERGGHLLLPERLESAWGWATQSLGTTVSPLSIASDGESVEVFDYLVDMRQRKDDIGGDVPDFVFEACLNYADEFNSESLADTAQRLGRYQIAESAWCKAVALRVDNLGETHPDAMATRTRLARLRGAFGKSRIALEELNNVIKTQEDTLGHAHPDTITSRGVLGHLLFTLGRLDDAEHELKFVYEYRERVLGYEHPESLVIRSELAQVHAEQRRLAIAEIEGNATLEAQRRVLGLEHPDTLSTLETVASIHWYQGRLSQARAENDELLSIQLTVLGKDHPDRLTARNNQSTVLWYQGHLHEAEAELRAVLNVRLKVQDEQHPYTLIARDNLTGILRDLGQLDEAERECRKVIFMRERALGGEHPVTLMSLNKLSFLLAAMDRFDEAVEVQRLVFSGRKAAWGLAHPQTLISVSNLAFFLDRSGREEDALAGLRIAVNARNEVLSSKHAGKESIEPWYVGGFKGPWAELRSIVDRCGAERGPQDIFAIVALDSVGRVCRDLMRFQQAETELRAVAELRSELLGNKSRKALRSRYRLGMVLIEMGRTDEALTLFRRVFRMQLDSLGSAHSDSVDTASLISLLTRNRQ